MLAYGKNMPKNNQISVLCADLIEKLTEKVKNYPEKNLHKIMKFVPEKKIYPIHAFQHLMEQKRCRDIYPTAPTRPNNLN